MLRDGPAAGGSAVIGRRGPPPQPTKLKLLAGNPGKRPINGREPQPIGLPDKPDFITGSAAEDSDRVIGSMPPGFFTSADSPTVAVFCVSLTLHRAALAQVARGGLTSKGLDGQAIANPMVGVLAREQLVLRASDRLGLSPAARVGLEMPEPGSGKFDGLIG